MSRVATFTFITDQAINLFVIKKNEQMRKKNYIVAISFFLLADNRFFLTKNLKFEIFIMKYKRK